MLKIDDIVSPFSNMSKKGKIVEVKHAQSSTWMTGGAPSHIRVLVVQHFDGDLVQYVSGDLMQHFD